MRRIVAAIALACVLVCGRASAQIINTKLAVQTATLSAWNSATALNATQTVFAAGDAGYDSVTVLLQETSTLTAGAITAEVTYDGTNWVTIPADAVMDPTSTTFAQISLPYTVQASTNKALLLMSKGWQGLRLKLSTQITGTGTVTPVVTYNPSVAVDTVVALSPTAANFNAAVTIADGGDTTLGAKADAKSTATDTTAVSIMQVLKEISAMEQAPASRAVTNAGTFAAQAQPTPVTTGGLSTCVLQTAASTNSTNCKNAAGQIYHIEVINTTSTIYYLRLYNASSAPTCSSATNFVRSIAVPHNSGAGAGFEAEYSMGEAYGTGISFCFTGGGSSTDNTNAATGIYLTIFYK